MSSRTSNLTVRADARGGGGASVCEAVGGSQPFVMITSLFWSLLTGLISFNLREKLSPDIVRKFNSQLASTVLTSRSPRADPQDAANDATPSFLGPTSTLVQTVPTLIQHDGVRILAPILEHAKTVCDFYFSRKNFRESQSLIDAIRNVFSKHLVVKIRTLLPEISELFGDENLLSLFGLFKNDLKLCMIFFGLLVKNNFSDSERFRKFWFIMLKWMIFSRYIELLISLVSNMIQFDDGTPLKVSLNLMRLLRTYLSDITPLSSLHHTGKDFSSRDELNKFIDAVKSKRNDLVTVFQSISPHILNGDNIRKHLEAIDICLEQLGERRSAETIARKTAKCFNIPIELLKHFDPRCTTHPNDVIRSLLLIAQKNNASRELVEFLNDPKGIFSTVVQSRIAYLQYLKRIQEAEQELEISMIETEQIRQKRERSMIETEQIRQKRLAEEIRTAELQNELGRKKELLAEEIRPADRQIKRQCIDPKESQGLAENDLRHSLNAMEKK
jgi:hypothetical protein